MEESGITAPELGSQEMQAWNLATGQHHSGRNDPLGALNDPTKLPAGARSGGERQRCEGRLEWLQRAARLGCQGGCTGHR